MKIIRSWTAKSSAWCGRSRIPNSSQSSMSLWRTCQRTSHLRNSQRCSTPLDPYFQPRFRWTPSRTRKASGSSASKKRPRCRRPSMNSTRRNSRARNSSWRGKTRSWMKARRHPSTTCKLRTSPSPGVMRNSRSSLNSSAHFLRSRSS